MLKSLPYQDFLISHLKDKNRAAGYIEAVFEEQKPEPELLKLALSNVAEALSEQSLTPEQGKLHRNKLDEILLQSGIELIYNLADWLNVLGLKLSVTVAKSADDNQIIHTVSNSEVKV
ncbi:helix-turn-helix domain-containing transcriptional regulator [Nodularia spumigena]|uniref:helix-turn-helix domain-containing transcriptional regulator n=1 Tax=Nodularia spumigena TaxID=70799 RepID=UPI002B1FEE4C|nr:transcriptional regulator [Nodularia spumigena]MEA5557857.1 transcriptional regulator [Nodularia spumigena CH309]